MNKWIESLRKYTTAIISLLVAVFIYRKGKQEERYKKLKENQDAVKKSKKIRSTLSDNNVVERLHAKYKR